MQFFKSIVQKLFRILSSSLIHNNPSKLDDFNILPYYIQIFLFPSLGKNQFKISCMVMINEFAHLVK